MSRSVIACPSKRSNKLCGRRSIASDGMNRVRIACQNGVEGKSCRHHVRQRLSVRIGMRNCSHSSWPEALPGGERNINTKDTYTRRPANRTDGDVERASQRPHVKLRRREYSSRTAAGQPRGLRG
jgi:predicted Zn-dependent protease